ncbi:replication initiation protein, partial [Klebsiella variicola subsp. variicola]
ASAYNLQFSAPLDDKEVMGIAKSIAKWTGSNFSKEAFDEYVIRTHTSDIQRIRGRKGGAIGGKKSNSGGRPSLGEPWIELGVSRRTYFRNKKRKGC